MAQASIEHRGEGSTRQSRGMDLFRDGAFERLSRVPEVWLVENTNGSINEVELDRGTCSCKDFEHHGHIDQFACKHLVAARLYSGWLRKSARALAPIFGESAWMDVAREGMR